MNNRSKRTQNDRQGRLIGLFLIGLLLFNFPLLSIFGKGEKWGSIPGLFIYIGVVWIGLIVVVYWLMRDISRGPEKPDKILPK
ncbi:MAG: hypothetical protein IPL49_21515 [Saprospirales bacterium]|nr:hypothetical protein [Saprospirales bacterium]